MLVNRKVDWEYQVNPDDQLKIATKSNETKLNTVLRLRCLMILVLLTGIAMFMTVRSEAIVRAGYELVQVKSQIIKIEKENDLLRLELAKLKSPQRIQSIATNQLGMIIPPSVYCAVNRNEEGNTTISKKDGESFVSRLTDSFKGEKTEANKAN